MGLASRLPYGTLTYCVCVCLVSFTKFERRDPCTTLQMLLKILTESGCRFSSINGPLGFGFGIEGAQLASVAARGLKGLSVGPVKENREGWS